MENNEILNKLEKIDKNTSKTLQVLSREKEEVEVEKVKLNEKLEKRREQNREYQKNWKKISFSTHEEVYFEYERFAKEEMGSSSLSAFLKSYSTLLFENRDFQKLFREFQILQKNDEKHQQVGFFTPQTQFNKLEKMAEDEGFTVGQLTQKVMLLLLSDEDLKKTIVTQIKFA